MQNFCPTANRCLGVLCWIEEASVNGLIYIYKEISIKKNWKKKTTKKTSKLPMSESVSKTSLRNGWQSC